MLLNGYSSSNVDCEQSNVTEDSGTMSSDESNKTTNNDDGLDDSLSTESNRSIISSEYGNTFGYSGIIDENCHIDDVEIPHVSNLVELERLDDLKDLPPELSALIQKTLHELDLKDNETT